MNFVKSFSQGFLILALLASSNAFAHKATSNHTHCTVAGKGVKVEGNTDAERKAACAKHPGSKWDETKEVKVELATPEAHPK